jgi:2',3'-cyclic-nucleotide 2'-phosphodiesterase (5'-nucleotidase family)
MARWASLVEKRRSERPVLVIDTGDFSLPPDTRQRDLKERYFFEAMELLRYDAIGIGEFETRAGLEGRFAAAKRYGLPLVSSNIFDRTLKKPAAPESVVRDIGGARTLFGRRGALRVGIFSVVLPSLIYRDGADGRQRYNVVDPKLSALAAATNLRARGCDIVIAVSHLGWQKSLELAREVPGIDVVLNGHREHTRTCEERVGSTVVVDTGEKEWSFTEVSVTFNGDALVVVVSDACGAALSLREDPRFTGLQKKYSEELKRLSSSAAKNRDR